MGDLISHRAKISRHWKNLSAETLSLCSNNLYHEKDNPTGYINLGTSTTNICDDTLPKKLKDSCKYDFDSLGYNEGHGTVKLRNTMAKFMTEFLESHEPVSPDDLFCINGITSCIDLLVHCIADPLEEFMVITPISDCTAANFFQRSFVRLWPVHLITEDSEHGNTDTAEEIMEKIINAYESARKANLQIRVFYLINPNPLGNIYSADLQMDILTFCNAKSLHVVVDEVYALSVFSKTKKFHSILKFTHIPDLDKTHVVFGLREGFGIAGLEVGVIYTKCKQLKRSLAQLSYFHSTPYLFMETVVKFLDDVEWCRKYIKNYQTYLALHYAYCFQYLRNSGVKVRKCSAGLGLWMDFRHLCGKSSEGEKKLFKYFLDKFHLYIALGEPFVCGFVPGWFRIVFSQNLSQLKEGLKRLVIALNEYQQND